MDSLANFSWIFETGQQSFYTSLISAEPHSTGIRGAIESLLQPALYLSLIIIIFRLLSGKRDWANLVASALTAVFLLQPATIKIEGRAPTQATMGQYLILVPVATIYSIFSRSVRSAEPSNTLLITDLTERQIAPFKDSDLARLMRDYTTFCQPSENGKTIAIEDWQAVGLRGGGGLGVPDDDLSIFSKATNQKALDSYFSWFGAFRAANTLAAAHSAGARRQAGIEALKSMQGRWPADGRYYSLPTEESWAGRFGKAKGSTDSYLDPRQTKTGLASKAVTEWPSGVHPPFAPENCLEAYLSAQAGAEAAYKGLRGSLNPANFSSSPPEEVSAIDSIAAWSNVVDKSLESMYGGAEGGVFAKARKAVAEVVGATNTVSAFFAQLDLVTELPRVVFTINFGLAMFVQLIPIITLVSIFAGAGVLLYALRLLAFGFTTLFLIELSFNMLAAQFAASQYLIAAQSISAQGVATDIEAQRGALLMMIAGAITLATMAAARLFGIMTPPSIKPTEGQLSGLIRGSVGMMAAAFTGGASAKGAIASAVAKSSKHGGGGGGGGGPSPSPTSPLSSTVQRSIRRMAAANSDNGRPASGEVASIYTLKNCKRPAPAQNDSPLVPKK